MRIPNLENEQRKFVKNMGPFRILEYLQDESVNPYNAEQAYFMAKMGVHRRQLVCYLNGKNGIRTQSGAMQWTAGGIRAETGIKGAGDFLGKMVKGSVTGESAVKPEYAGVGLLVLEPTYKYLILQDVASWGSGLVVEDGMFLASESTVQMNVVSRKSVSSALAGNEGLFNMCFTGSGVVALESNVPESELIEIELKDDELKIDGHMAVAWSASLAFTVERSSKTLLGSAMTGDGLVNVYRGTGKVLMAPVTDSGSLVAATVSAAPAAGKAAIKLPFGG